MHTVTLESFLNAVMLHFFSGVLRLCNQLFTFTAKVNYRFQQAACRGSGSKQKCLTAGAERGAAASAP